MDLAAAARRHLRRILRAGGSRHGSRNAALLIEEFGGLQAVLAAPAGRVARIIGDDQAGRRAIRDFRSAMMHALCEPVAARPLIDDWPALTRYLVADMGRQTVEHARVLFLDSRSRLLRDEVMWTGTVDQVVFHVREVIGRAIELGAASMVLVHNHPSGDPSPSRTDIDLTRAVRDIARKLGMNVIDHVIVGRGEVVSMRQSGLL